MTIEFEGLTMNQLAERNAELVTEISKANELLGNTGFMTLSELITLTMSEKDKQIAELQRKVEALAVENVALKSGSGLFFSYGSEHGFDLHESAKEAIESAEGAIDDYRGDACDGWSEETDSVCWGVVMQQSTKVGERPRTEEDSCDPAIDTICDYALLPNVETPATDAAIAEIEARGVEYVADHIDLLDDRMMVSSTSIREYAAKLRAGEVSNG